MQIKALLKRGAMPIASLMAALLLAGCAGFSPDGGFDTVADTTRERLGQQATWVRTDADRAAVQERTRELLAQPLDAERAIQVALLNNRGLQAQYADLGIAEADYVQATRLPNPGFSFSRKTSGDELKIERAVTVGFMNLLALPFAARIEQGRFAQTRLAVADATLRRAESTRRAWVQAVAAEQAARYAEQVRRAAETGALFARDLARSGNVSALDHAREQGFYADAAAQLARARERALSARERLTRELGLWGNDLAFQLPERLPDLPANRPSMQGLEGYAISNRLDLQAGRAQLDSLSRSLGLTRATRFISVIDASYLFNSETGRPRETGYGIDIEVPLFDWGGARVARAENIYLQAASRLAEQAINARSTVRETYAGYQARYDIALHYRDEVVPLRKRIGDENLLRYNGMLVSVFELLTDAREQINAVNSYLDAQRDFWLAESDLRSALGGRLPPNTQPQ
ncbi:MULTISPECIES: TolC family protein [unclassified Cupriavidus]|uniref:TolC family protein n=1 Tax=unclassified Cupriavidus TaxID=2640874 RepID=UPI001F3DB20E|nr:TolC family protein [Cupriavidus sp. SW-Y-13]